MSHIDKKIKLEIHNHNHNNNNNNNSFNIYTICNTNYYISISIYPTARNYWFSVFYLEKATR